MSRTSVAVGLVLVVFEDCMEPNAASRCLAQRRLCLNASQQKRNTLDDTMPLLSYSDMRSAGLEY
jgi:hypothetical protein